MKSISTDSIKSFIFIATTAVGVTLYVHQTFATNIRVDRIEKQSGHNNKVNCLIALKLNIEQSKLEKICNLTL